MLMNSTPGSEQPGEKSPGQPQLPNPATLVGVSPPSAADQAVAANFYQAYHLYQFLTTVTTAARQLDSALGGSQQIPAPLADAATAAANSAAAHLSAMPSLADADGGPAAAAPPRKSLHPLAVPQLPATSAPFGLPPQITPPVTPPSGLDLQTVLARLGTNTASTSRAEPFTPAKRPTPLGAPDAAPSPVSAMLSGLKRRRVRVIQSLDDRCPPTPEKPETVKTTTMNLASRLAAMAAEAGSPSKVAAEARRASSDTSTSTASPCSKGKTAAPPTPSKAGGDGLAVGSWSEEDKAELIKAVAKMKPCGAADWEEVAERLNASRPTPIPRRGASAERMYRTLTDPGYRKANNPHGRRIHPRKGHTPMHVMATYSLQQLPKNEGNLTQITELITKTERFASELDWTPRPGTKTYPRWKDALVGCFKPGRYGHLIKTDRKLDGLTVYKLLVDKMAKP